MDRADSPSTRTSVLLRSKSSSEYAARICVKNAFTSVIDERRPIGLTSEMRSGSSQSVTNCSASILTTAWRYESSNDSISATDFSVLVPLAGGAGLHAAVHVSNPTINIDRNAVVAMTSRVPVGRDYWPARQPRFAR